MLSLHDIRRARVKGIARRYGKIVSCRESKDGDMSVLTDNGVLVYYENSVHRVTVDDLRSDFELQIVV